MICKIPPIKRSDLAVRTVNCLIYGGYCKVGDYGYKNGKKYFGPNFDLEWDRINQDYHTLHRIRNMGNKSLKLVAEWLLLIRNTYPELLQGNKESYLTKANEYIEKSAYGLTTHMNRLQKTAILEFAKWLEMSRPTPLAPDPPSASGNAGENNQSTPASREHK